MKQKRTEKIRSFFLFRGAFPTRFLPPLRYNEEKRPGGGQALKRGELAVKLERWEPLAPCAACFLADRSALRRAAFRRLCALCPRACRRGGEAESAALPRCSAVWPGALVFLDFSHALRTLAVAVLLYTANNAFCETRWYRSRRFLPAMTALMYLAVELVYLLQAGADRRRCAF